MPELTGAAVLGTAQIGRIQLSESGGEQVFDVALDDLRVDKQPIPHDTRFPIAMIGQLGDAATSTPVPVLTPERSELAADTPTATAAPQPDTRTARISMAAEEDAAIGEAAATPVSGGLSGEYFDSADLTNPVLTRLDPTVDFAWGSGSPDPAIGPDTFSVRWTGQVRAEASETYTFFTSSNDGVRLWIEGQPLVDNWTPHSVREESGTIALTAGQWYPVVLEYFEGAGSATIRLSYSSATTSKQIIPASNLSPDAPSSSPTATPSVSPTPTAKKHPYQRRRRQRRSPAALFLLQLRQAAHLCWP